ncbi:CD209 antigen-like [Antennarius striatus]|uniref:CD209 antigen-like n=1 Tax=Antennarius striatus TaxID=241820 RepID=UPI0035B37E43
MDVMEMENDVYFNKSLTMEELITKDVQRRKPPSRCLTVSLGLLCAVLLAGNIGQIIYYEIAVHHLSAEASPSPRLDSLQGGDERKSCEARLSNATGETKKLQQRLDSLTNERDRLQTGFHKIKNERDQMRTSYNASRRESDRLRTSYDDVQRKLKGLQSDYDKVTARNNRLRIEYDGLQKEKSKQRSSLQQLQRNHSSLRRDMDQLGRNYDEMSSRITRLQSRYDSLRRDNEQLKANHSGLLTDEHQLRTLLDAVRRSRMCDTGWTKFNTGCYFVSTEKKNWTSSREECIANGADLVVVDSRDEQVFINRLVNSTQNAWIGLNDFYQEGKWMWVDGSAITTRYWQDDQPNSYGGEQDCGELVPSGTSSGIGEWNDDGCFAVQIWICEK